MFKTLMRAGLLAATVSFCAASGASAAMQMPAPAALLTGASQATPVTFWAQPYPYRYVPARHCPLVRVETPYGWYMDRVCAPVGPVLRRAY
ncbi:RecB family exonuclease [Bradyrhizobium sp. CIR18]|nr:RecB family exonuclease [Bradyrhizobium sp. CIR18]